MNLWLKSESDEPGLASSKKQPRICVSIAVRGSLALITRKAQEAIDYGADMVEIRLDYLDRVNVPLLRRYLTGLENRLILTCRKRDEGGRFGGSEKERVRILTEIAEWDGPMLDIELSTIQRNSTLFKSKSENIIISWHDFKRTPGRPILLRKVEEAMQLGGIAKIVTTARNVTDNATILSLYKAAHKGSLIAFCMGEKGMISRILSPMVGSPLAYTFFGSNPVVPGQFSLDEFRDLYGIMSLGT